MEAERLGKWARLLCGYCLSVTPGETILIGCDWEGAALATAAAREVILAGAQPLLRIEPTGLLEFYLENAALDLLAAPPPAVIEETRLVDARIRISAESDLTSLSKIDPRRQAIFDRGRREIRRIAGKKRWALTQYPTRAYADAAGMSLAEYEAFAAAAMFLDQPDPSACWVELGKNQRSLVDFMSNVRKIRIEAPGTDVSLEVADRTWINSDGKRNMPSGEIFTGPLEDSAQGALRCAFPTHRDGRIIAGIELEFDHGKVIKAKAENEQEYLTAMIDLDPGASRLGELGIGLNGGINRFTGSILYDEKIGGTVHLALGQSYPETGGTNQSALHWDLIVDTRREGRITADGALVFENGRWLIG